jgi:hypothetical protein
MRSTELELSTSPRATWVWAVDEDHARELRELLAAAGCSAYPAAGRNAEARVLDLDIGVVAADGLDALVVAGYSFRWSVQQADANRGSDLYGIPVAGSSV